MIAVIFFNSVYNLIPVRAGPDHFIIFDQTLLISEKQPLDPYLKSYRYEDHAA